MAGRTLGRRWCSSAARAAGIAPPIQVKLTETAGRGVFASRKIGAGDVILTEFPVISHPSPTNMGKVCWWCLKRFSLITKPFLQLESSWMAYCSQECTDLAKGCMDLENNRHWKEFHDYCRESNLRFPLLVKRLACMVATNMASFDVLDILYPPSPPGFLQRWLEERKLLTETLTRCGIDSASTKCILFLRFFPSKRVRFSFDRLEVLSDSWYAGALSRIHLNTFRVETIATEITNLEAALVDSITGDDVVGSAVYILPSMFNHSCDANVNIYWRENAFVQLKALQPIEPGKELCITYIDASMGCEARRALLQDAYGFHYSRIHD
ncbi:histone-lysine N-methyltransferase ATXR4 isoform X2 [Selaginella moellendorffii]|uniref:histone-lysine N-methyltransferase ATXR4 isoform X2 n=1 Tax=Selaginella moellendorffii TaxID=88036 RepID=UPI000D1C8588|nr:histone-lysine N-methyltransferase ATXR4 isoform X2 [Selaginella moellendorffii]|eukprot:XP_024523282.1 histone-lysine N-methyltransferase ATXR4 isoform X2 [Selaginella moellendorffii]